MIARMHFVSGLPRSGSTLLCALLRQNPRFTAAMTSPLASLCSAVHPKMCGGEFDVFFDDVKRASILHALFDAYYGDSLGDGVVFDTNRSWTGRASLLARLYPGTRIICCVRDIGWIIDSIERMLAKNPLELSRMFKFQPGSSAYARAEILMNSESGLIGLAWSTLREAWFGQEAARLIVVPYEQLAKNPRLTLERLYAELGEPLFAHDLDHVEYDEPDYDTHIGMPGLHKVREKVEYTVRQPCIPPDLFVKYAGTSFWEKPELNTRHVKILA